MSLLESQCARLLLEFLEKLKEEKRLSIHTHLNCTEVRNILRLPDDICVQFFSLMEQAEEIFYTLN